MKVNPLRAIVLILVRPTRFVDVTVEHDVELSFEGNEALQKQFPGRKLPEERLKEIRKGAWAELAVCGGASSWPHGPLFWRFYSDLSQDFC